MNKNIKMHIDGYGFELCMGEIDRNTAMFLLQNPADNLGISIRTAKGGKPLPYHSFANKFKGEIIDEDKSQLQILTESDEVIWSFKLIEYSQIIQSMGYGVEYLFKDCLEENRKAYKKNKWKIISHSVEIMEPERDKTYLISIRKKMGIFLQTQSFYQPFSTNYPTFRYIDLLYFGLNFYIHKICCKGFYDLDAGKTMYIDSEIKQAIIMDQTVYGYF